jgi:hypothetical protein
MRVVSIATHGAAVEWSPDSWLWQMVRSRNRPPMPPRKKKYLAIAAEEHDEAIK